MAAAHRLVLRDPDIPVGTHLQAIVHVGIDCVAHTVGECAVGSAVQVGLALEHREAAPQRLEVSHTRFLTLSSDSPAFALQLSSPASELRPVALTEATRRQARLAARRRDAPRSCAAERRAPTVASSSSSSRICNPSAPSRSVPRQRRAGQASITAGRWHLYLQLRQQCRSQLAWMARRLATPRRRRRHEDAPEGKLALLRALKARIVPLPFDAWWEAIETAGCPGQPGTYIDACAIRQRWPATPHPRRGILEQLPEVEPSSRRSAAAPLACGIASRRAPAQAECQGDRLRARDGGSP